MLAGLRTCIFPRRFARLESLAPAYSALTTSYPTPSRRNCSSHNMADDSSAAGERQSVQHNGKEYTAIKEGLAYILNQAPADEPQKPKPKPKNGQPGEGSQAVFYNPIQQFNRDLTVLAIRAYANHVDAAKKKKKEKKRDIDAKKGRKRKRDQTEGGEKEEKPTEGDGDVQNGDENRAAPVAPAATSSIPRHEFTILDALTATGLRALRYAAEIPQTTCVVANDLSTSAVEAMKVNIEYNGLGDRIQPNLGDARAYMYSLQGASSVKGVKIKKFDVIDLDPYGTAAPFFDAAVQAIKDDGLLCVTCTDAGVWASTGYPEKTFALYGGLPCKGPHSHEGGLRLILHGIAMSAARYGLAIEPLLSLSVDFYSRFFIRARQSPVDVKHLASNVMLVYNCDSGCGSWSTQPLGSTRVRMDKKGNPFYNYTLAQGPPSNSHCEHCGFKTHVSGPMWAGPLHNHHFIQTILDMLPGLDQKTYCTVDRINGMLTTALEENLDLVPIPTDKSSSPSASPPPAESESPNPPGLIPRIDPAVHDPHPFYFTLGSLSSVVHTHTVPFDAFRGALRHLGYRSTRSHAKPNSIRTDAPWDVIWEIMREWARQKSPIREGSLSPKSAGAAIMAKSRENIAKLAEAEKEHPGSDAVDQAISTLKKDVTAALDTGKDVTDLLTKLEAAVFRSRSFKTAPAPPPLKVHDQKQVGSTTTNRPHPSTLDIVFDEALGKDVPQNQGGKGKRLVRYQMNPRANWGPLSRASAR